MKTLTLFTIALLITTGCNEDKKEEIKKEIKQDVKEETSFYTKRYYLDHPDFRKQRIKECDTAEKMTITQLRDCDNAYNAANELTKNKFIEL